MDLRYNNIFPRVLNPEVKLIKTLIIPVKIVLEVTNLKNMQTFGLDQAQKWPPVLYLSLSQSYRQSSYTAVISFVIERAIHEVDLYLNLRARAMSNRSRLNKLLKFFLGVSAPADFLMNPK